MTWEKEAKKEKKKRNQFRGFLAYHHFNFVFLPLLLQQRFKHNTQKSRKSWKARNKMFKNKNKCRHISKDKEKAEKCLDGRRRHIYQAIHNECTEKKIFLAWKKWQGHDFLHTHTHFIYVSSEKCVFPRKGKSNLLFWFTEGN